MPTFDPQQWAQINEHLDRVLELSGQEQDTFLAILERSNAAIASEIRRLLAASQQREFVSFLSRPVAPIAPIATSNNLAGHQIGSYVIEAELGRGGMGSVWRAARSDGRFEGRVAIKLLNASLIGRPAEQRFLREGTVLASLQHPHIAHLLDSGVAANGQPYLVLEFVEGVRIDQYCETRSLTIRSRIGIFLDVLAAVAHAHSHLVVHRDLKPTNILVTGDGAVKLLDFGIAGLLSPEGATGSAPLTIDAASAFTPEYAAPEQLLNHPVTTATDVYALGLVLFVLLTGRHPHTDNGDSLAERVRTIVERDAPRLSQSTAGPDTARVLRGDLDNVVAKALRRDPLERYATVDAFADDLKRFLVDEPVRARPTSLAYRSSKFVTRHRGGVASAGIVALALLGTGAFAVLQMFEARAQRDNAVFEAKRASAQSELTEFLLGNGQGQVPGDAEHSRLNRARDLIHRRFRTDPLLQAGLLIGLSGRYIDAGDIKGAAVLMKEAEAIGSRLNNAHLNADIACGRAQDAVDAGDLTAAHDQQAIAQRNIAQLKVVPSGLTAECAMATANIAQREGNYAQAITVMRDTMRALEHEGMQRTSRYTSIAHEYARSLSKSGDYRGAWAAEQSALAITTDVGRDDSDAFYAMVNVGASSLISGGQPRRAFEYLQQTMDKAHRVSPDSELPFYLDGTRALAHAAMGSPLAVDAQLMTLAATAEKQGLQSLVHRYRSTALRIAIDRGDLAAAETQWASLTALQAKLLANNAWRRDAVHLLLEHVRLELAEQHPAAAEQLMNQAVAMIAPDKQPSDPEWRDAVLLRAEIEYAKRDYAAAALDAQAALQRARAEAVDPQSSAWIGEALTWRARSEAQLGNKQAASATAREALPHLMSNLDPGHPSIAMARDLAALKPSAQ